MTVQAQETGGLNLRYNAGITTFKKYPRPGDMAMYEQLLQVVLLELEEIAAQHPGVPILMLCTRERPDVFATTSRIITVAPGYGVTIVDAAADTFFYFTALLNADFVVRAMEPRPDGSRGYAVWCRPDGFQAFEKTAAGELQRIATNLVSHLLPPSLQAQVRTPVQEDAHGHPR